MLFAAVRLSAVGTKRTFAALQHFGRYWSNSGHRSTLALNGSVANDPFGRHVSCARLFRHSTAKTRENTDAQAVGHFHRAGGNRAGRLAGLQSRRPNLARSRDDPRTGAKFHADRKSRLRAVPRPLVRTVPPARLRPRRPMLVRSLLIATELVRQQT
jgi:hypothetical protein